MNGEIKEAVKAGQHYMAVTYQEIMLQYSIHEGRTKIEVQEELKWKQQHLKFLTAHWQLRVVLVLLT